MTTVVSKAGRTFGIVSLVVLFAVGRNAFAQTIPDVSVTGPALAANVHGAYNGNGSASVGSATVVNAPVTGNGDMALIVGGQSTSLRFCVGKADFWGVEHGVIMPVGSLVLGASSLNGSSYSLVQNVGAATVTGTFATGGYGLGLNSWVATSQNTAFIQLTNTGSQPLTFTSQLRDAYGTTGNPGTLGYSTSSSWLNVSPDAVYLELGNHINIGTNAPLQGRIADMRIFDQALSSAQLNALDTPGAVPHLLQWATTNQGTATLRGTASLNTSDPHGGSVVLTGDANSEVAVGVMGLPQEKFTVSAWVNMSAINSGNENCIFAGLINHGTGGYPFMRGLKLVVLPNGRLSASLNTSGSAGTGQWDGFSTDAVNAYSATASGALPLNQWIQTAVTYDGYALKIYTNGTVVGVTTSFPPAALVNGYNKTAIHLGDTNLAFNGCAPRGVLMQSVFGVPVADNGGTLSFTVPVGGQATIALAAVTDRNTNNFFAAAQQQSQQANATTRNSLYQEHNQWWSNFWSKSFVQVSDPFIRDEWYASLYLLACSSRSNCPPPGLWGNYITSTGMYWEGDYTLDYNVQATFWCALACNHPELTDNYDQLLLDCIPRGQAIAQHWGYQGIYLYTHLIPFPGWSDDGYTFWSQKSGSLFAAVNCAMRWRYTHDTNYAARIYPYMKGVSDFWDNYLVLNNNQYVDYSDAAGESGYTTDVNPATTLAFIQLVYPALIEMSQTLNVDAGRRAKWSDVVARLTPLPIVPATSISSLAALGTNYVTPDMYVIRDTTSGTEFPNPRVNVYQDHQSRNSSPGMNCTQTIFPGWNIGLESDPATLAAALNTVYLAAEWYDDNSCSTFYPSAAAVGYAPGEILSNLRAAIIYHANPNFMFTFPGGGTENYSIVPATLANMFLQSYQTNLHVFPNWPADENASFGNLNACGGFLVSSAMTNGMIPYVQITSTAGRQLRLVNPWPGMTFQIASTVNSTTQFAGAVLSRQTQVGEVLTLTPVPIPAPSAPSNLTATAGIERVTLSWAAASNALSYFVKRATVSGGPYTTVSIVNTTNCTDTGLFGGTPYFYVVTAVNLSGESANSVEAGATPTANVPAPWMARDIGSVGATGSESFDNGVFTLTGSGDDIWNSADAFRFVHEAVTGNCTVVARVASVQNIDSWSKAGVMVRESLNANSANAFVAVTPGNGVTWQYRSSTGANSANSATASLTAPYWVKLVRSGSTFTGYRSADGVNWIQLGSTTISMASTVYVGLAVTAHNNTSLCQAVFDNVTAPGWPPPAPPAPTGLVATAGREQVMLSWVASSNATSYNVKRSTTDGGSYSIIANVSTTNFTDTGMIGGTPYFYVVSAVNAGGESTNSDQAGATPTILPKLAGAIIGTPGSWNNAGDTIIKVFDGNLNTFFDGPTGNGCWVGWDFGVGVSNIIAKINYCPRAGFSDRMPGGVFQGANLADFSNAVMLASVTTQPTEGGFTTVIVTSTAAFRYVRYLSPDNSWGNVAELEFYGYPFSVPTPPAPTGLLATTVSTSQINLAWNTLSNATSYNVKRSLTNGGPYATIASGLTVTNFQDDGLAGGTTYYYVVSAMVGGSETTNSTQAAAATLSPRLGSLIHRYSFDESGGSTIADAVGGPVWNGTLLNGGALAGGQLALSSSSLQYATLPAGIVNSMSNVTVMAWVNLASVTYWSRLFDFGNDATSYLYLTPRNGFDYTARFAISTSGAGGEQKINGNAAVNPSAWHQVAVSLNAGTGILYVDGEAIGTNSSLSINPSSLGNTTHNYLGRSQSGSEPYYDGLLDEFRIYNAGLSAAEIAATVALGPEQQLSTNRPAISLAPAGTDLMLSWPLVNAGYTLQSCTNLTAGDWQTVTLPAPQIVGDRWQMQLPSVAADQVFYRLSK